MIGHHIADRFVLPIPSTRPPLVTKPTLPILAITFFVLLALPGALARGQVIPPADIVIPASPSEEEMNRAKAKIAEFLKNNRQSNPARSSGDPILDDVLDVIRRRGSVIEGSALDAGTAEGQSLAPGNTAAERRGDYSGPGPSSSSDAAYVAAERLLRAARSLQRLAGQDAGNDELARAMRRQAAKLMIDAISQESLNEGGAL